MTQYRELPEAKSADEFKVGDLIRFYDGFGHTDSILECESKGDMLEANVRGRYENYHFKACRKLEEVKPREIWVNEYKLNPSTRIFGDIYKSPEDARKDARNYAPGNLDYIRTVKFVEVIDD